MGEENSLRKNNPLKKAPKRRVSPSTMVVIAIVISLLFAIYAYTLLQQAHDESIVSCSTNEEQTPLETSELLLFAEPNSQVARIQIKIEKEECYTLKLLESGKHDIEEYPNYGVDEARIASMLKHALSLQAVSLIDSNPDSIEIYGLLNPKIVADISYTNGNSHRLLLGNTIPTQTSIYAMFDNNPAVYELKAAVLSSFNRPLSSIHTVRFQSKIDTDAITHLIIEKEDERELEIISSENDLYLYDIIHPFKWHAHSVRMTEEITNAIGNLKISKYVGKETSECDYGFSEPKAYIYAADTSGNILTLSVGNEVANGTYVKIDNTNDVYLTDTEQLSFLSNATAYHLADQFTHLVQIDAVSAVNIQARENSYHLQILHASQNSTLFRINHINLSEKAGRILYQEIVSLQFDNVLIDSDLSKSTPAYSIDFIDISGNPITKVEYLPYDDAYYAVRKDEECHFVIKKAKLENLYALINNIVMHAGSE